VGLEPTTFCLRNENSIHLSYGRTRGYPIRFDYSGQSYFFSNEQMGDDRLGQVGMETKTSAQIQNDFSYHLMKKADCIAGQKVHDALSQAAAVILENLPKCRACDNAYERLREAKLWADEALCFDRDPKQFDMES
jgi:hypothetical protein